MSRVLRWGVLSTANIGRAAVIPAIKASGNGRLVAVASRNAERAEAFASKNGIPEAYGTYEEMLEDPELDALYIPLPNSGHCEWTVKALAAGKHVLCEKPLALNAAECREMGEAADRHGVVLMEAFMYRFHPRTERVIQMVRDGVIGPLRSIRASFSFRLRTRENIRLDPDLGGGALMDVGCYCVNVIRTLVGTEPVEVQAFANWGDTGVDEEMVGTLRFADGLLAQFDCALTLERREQYQVAGPDGHLDIASAFLPGAERTAIAEHRGRDGVTEHPIGGADEYQLMVEHFADSVLHGTPVRYSPEEASANMRVIEALYRSARDEGKPTTV